jgi:hypothetical protein
MANKRKGPKVCPCCGAWRPKVGNLVHVAGCHAATWNTITNHQAKIAGMEGKLERERLKQVWNTQQLAKKLGFGSPRNMRKGEKSVNSHWFIPGGGVETKRSKH